ncbi:MAG: hypothetical protein DI532_20605 [Azospirillum brasilense]|nr:MAG: hypothetical protein DI532_20605 [Azospirillum brasilense]
MERLATGALVCGEPLRHRRAQLDLFGQCDEESVGAAGCGPLALSWNTDACLGVATLETYSRVRGAVVSMVTAAHFHGLLSGPPGALWLGVPLKVYVPKLGPDELRIIRWSNRQAFGIGVTDVPVPKGIVRCTTRERTIVDLVRYGRYVGGTAAAVSCLRAYAGSGGTEEGIRKVVDALRVSRPARFVLDTLLLGMEGRP